VLTSSIGAHFAIEMFDLAGYHPFKGAEPASVVVCKSPAGFRATYGPYAGECVPPPPPNPSPVVQQPEISS
jgi:hypothetical protein